MRVGFLRVFCFKYPFVFFLLIRTVFLSPDSLFSQYDGGHTTRELTEDYMYEYEGGMDFQKYDFSSQNSVQSQFPSASVSLKASGSKGQINTLNLDGGSSAHTRLAFNGHVIDFVQLPIFDAHLLPLDLLSQVEIYTFNFGALGISAPSGLINYRVGTKSDHQLKLNLSAGSFGLYEGKLLFKPLIKEKQNQVWGLSYGQAENKFEYRNEFNIANTTQNLDYRKLSLMHEMTHTIWQISSSINWKEAGTGIKYSSTARQEDLFALHGWRGKWENNLLNMDYSYWFLKYADLPIEDTHENHQIKLEYLKDWKRDNYQLKLRLKNKTSYITSTKLDEWWDEELFLGIENKFSLNKLDIKLDMANQYHFSYGYTVIPALGVILKPHPLVLIDSRVSRVFQRPSYNDLYWPKDSQAEGNPDLLPEDGVKWKLGTRLFLAPCMVQVSASYSSMENLIVWNNLNGPWKPENIGKSLVYGVQLSVMYASLLKKSLLKVKTSFSWNRNINNDPASLYFRKFQVYSPEYKAQLSVNLSRKKLWDISMNLRYSSERFVTPANTVSLPAYLLLDLHLSYRMFFVNVNNVLDQDTREIQGYPQPGINFNTGIKIEI